MTEILNQMRESLDKIDRQLFWALVGCVIGLALVVIGLVL